MTALTINGADMTADIMKMLPLDVVSILSGFTYITTESSNMHTQGKPKNDPGLGLLNNV
jgi:hypothetical protein